MKRILNILFLLTFFGGNIYAQATAFTLSNDKTLSTSLSESSGLTYCRGKLWTHNDSGNGPKIYALNPSNGTIIQTITLEGVINNDWEDLASDGYHLYIADTGNNVNGARTNLAILKLNLDDIPTTGDVAIPFEKIEIIRFYYPEQGETPSPVAANSSPYDCEAILIRNDVIHLYTKDWSSANAGYSTSEYLLPNIPHPQGMKYAAKFFNQHNKIGFLVTSADNAGINQVALIGYKNEKDLGMHYIRIYSDFEGDDISTGKIYTKNLGSPLSMGQVEAICFGEDPFTGYISNEQFSMSIINYSAKIKTFDLSYIPSDKENITTGTAGGGIQGAIRYNTQMMHLEGFNGLHWIPLDINN